MMASVADTATEAAVLGHTMSLGYEYGRNRVRINSLCPSPIQTRIAEGPGGPHYHWQCD